MVYRLLDWGVVGGVYYKVQIVSYASAKITLNDEISAKVEKYLRCYEVGRTTGSKITLTPSKFTSGKQK